MYPFLVVLFVCFIIFFQVETYFYMMASDIKSFITKDKTPFEIATKSH